MNIKFKQLALSTAIFSLVGCANNDLVNVGYQFSPEKKDATGETIKANATFANTLEFENDTQDFSDAIKDWISRDDFLVICANGLSEHKCLKADNPMIWEMESYKGFIGPSTPGGANQYPEQFSSNNDAPDTVNPSLWRNAKLNMYYGLFAVLDNGEKGVADLGDIFQVRGYDLSNITFVKGSSGWIVFDPLISPQTATASLNLINRSLSGEQDTKVSAVIYSHSHTDHYGGVNGLELIDGARIYAPEGFTEHAVSENVIAGNAMGRRAVYMYGSLLPRDLQGTVNAGLGMTTSTGVPGLKVPTDFVSEQTELSDKVACNDVSRCFWDVDGINMQFQLTPGTEAPAEMNTWLPDQDALWMAENTTNTMHNILTLRGAKVRDALKWAHYLNDTIDRYAGQAKVKFQSHHWPVWGENEISEYLVKQRDVYKFMHDQTVRWMNQGYNGEEISEAIKLPESLQKNWATRGYYGTLRHNTRAIYQYYMGWYNGNPSNLNNLPPLESAVRYVHYMGGVKAVLAKATDAYSDGDYRWVAEVTKHVVFAQSVCEKKLATTLPYTDGLCSVDYKRGKYLLADAYEQLGYQAESGPWRSVYLQGAYELRSGIPKDIQALETASPETIQAMPIDMLFDYWGVRLNAEEADGKSIALAIELSDVTESDELCSNEAASDDSTIKCKYYLSLGNSVLNYTLKAPAAPSSQLVYIKKSTLDQLLSANHSSLVEKSSKTAVDNCQTDELCVYIEGGDIEDLTGLTELLDTYDFWFNIVTPNVPLKARL